MSIRSERNEEIYKKIQEDYKKSGKTVDYCCVKNGITTRTYYNIKKRLETAETTETPVRQKRNHKRKQLITDNTEIELVPSITEPKKYSKKKSSLSNILRECNKEINNKI